MKEHLRTSVKEVDSFVDLETGEVVSTMVNEQKYIAGTKSQFYLMYASMLSGIVSYSSDNKIKLFAALIEDYAEGQLFSFGKDMKSIFADRINCSSRSLDNSLSELVKIQFVVKAGRNLYRINPRHVFKGSTMDRKKALKAVLELECPDC